MDSKTMKNLMEYIEDEWTYVFENAKNSGARSKKNEIDVVTDVDEQMERKIVEKIKEIDSTAEIVGEEFGEVEGNSTRKFHVDPVDGTFNFSRGFPEYCVSVGYEENGFPKLAGIFFPFFNEQVIVSPSSLNFKNNFLSKRFQSSGFSDKKDLEGASIAMSYINKDADKLGNIIKDMGQTSVVRQPMCCVYASLMIAIGGFDAAVFRSVYSWDIAPGYAMINSQEQGNISDEKGNQDWNSVLEGEFVVLSGNNTIHSKILDIVNKY